MNQSHPKVLGTADEQHRKNVKMIVELRKKCNLPKSGYGRCVYDRQIGCEYEVRGIREGLGHELNGH
jgi:hypothetical protein